ncbi:cell division protein FtsI [Candidatus Nitrosoglobus terrae]|uniref:Cell division protein FtsL n=1 Tax=Candidatus Nitrosoglobus terrae TaxID=1630141 RepID=A0A1Q2SKE4_9GAMM|nr:cell division protein FtsL [Candidatus Nitrosoglobus terrae]BAW79589.1 cell division protein FtsI [Candidatus Nitrosoglobus terrae]
MMIRWLLLGVLVALALISGVGVVYTKHENRKLFIELQKFYKIRDQLDDEWGRLLLEQSTLSRQGRVEHLAREKLGLLMPDSTEIVILKLK